MIFSEDLEKIFGKRPWVREELHPENQEEEKTSEADVPENIISGEGNAEADNS